jgi:hypothetical protein
MSAFARADFSLPAFALVIPAFQHFSVSSEPARGLEIVRKWL